MNILLAGAGAMGKRHLEGLLKSEPAPRVWVYDTSVEALEQLKQDFSDYPDVNQQLKTITSLDDLDNTADGAIIATSAHKRLELLQSVLASGIMNILVEKPVEQSLKNVQKSINLVEDAGAKAYVNFTRRVFEHHKNFQNMMQTYPQFAGLKHIQVLGGAVGIGCNGGHYLDLLVYLTGAQDYKLNFANVEDEVIPSGRGEHYADFGGAAQFDLLDRSGNKLASCYVELSARSSAPPIMSIMGQHARLHIDEFQKTYTLTMRKEDSELPMYRYFADYDGINTHSFDQAPLWQGTHEWMKSLDGVSIRLPEMKDTLLVHRLLFEWLTHSNSFKETFPIT